VRGRRRIRSAERLHDRAMACAALAAAAIAIVVVAPAVLAPVGVLYAAWPPWITDEPAPEPVYPEITVDHEWLASLAGRSDVVLVDARDESPYLDGHIPGAISIPSRSLRAPLAAGPYLGSQGLTGSERFVCYADSTLSGEGATLFWFLEVAGATRVSLLEGGIGRWVASGRDLETTPRRRPPTSWTAAPDLSRLATQEYVRLHFGEPGYEILDVREWSLWAGSAGAPDQATGLRNGHIPHSLPFSFHDFFTVDGVLRAPPETRSIFSDLGPRPSTPVDLQDEIIVHGDGLSGRGSVGYFLLRRAGIGKVRLFPGGWTQWASDTSLPVVRFIDAAELEARIGAERRWFRPDARASGFALFDVRHDSDWNRGHIPGSVSLSSSVYADSLEVFMNRYWPDIDRETTPIITYCYGSNCIRSRLTSTVSARAGFLNVERFYGGVEEWRGSGGELTQ
jgi:thiosulfate/3-mercaptopyruvate sulfurtransferase